MTINTPNGTISRPPRTIITTDGRGGCPGGDASGPYSTGNNLLTQTFTLSTTASVWIHGRMIFNDSGRCDMRLFINNGSVDVGLNWVGSGTTWEEEDVAWAGSLAAGSYNIELRSSSCAGRWGCGGNWGEINTIIFE